MTQFPFRSTGTLIAFASLAAVLGRANEAEAHGETPRGGATGAINTVGANMNHGANSFGLRFEMRQFAQFSDDKLMGFARAGEDVHMHSQELSAFIASSWGLSEEWSLDVNLPFNAFRNFKEGVMGANGSPELVRDDFSAGVGDLLLFTRFRPIHRGPHHFALLGGLKLPTGNTRQTTNDGERLGAHNQPGSGSIDLQLGAAYTYTVDGFELSADAIVHVRTEGATNYHGGNILQADIALSYGFGAIAPVFELNAIWSERDVENEEVLTNSGIATLYASPGLRLAIGGGHTLIASASIPVVQALPGIQNDERFRASLGYAFSFSFDDDHHDEDDGVHVHEDGTVHKHE